MEEIKRFELLLFLVCLQYKIVLEIWTVLKKNWLFSQMLPNTTLAAVPAGAGEKTTVA